MKFIKLFRVARLKDKLINKRGINDLSRWRQYGGTLDRSKPPTAE